MDPFTLALIAAGISGGVDLASEPSEFRQFIKGANRQKAMVREGQRMANIGESTAQVAGGVEGGSLADRRRALLNQPYESQVAEIKREKRHRRKKRGVNMLKKLAGIGGNIAGGIAGMGGKSPGSPMPDMAAGSGSFGNPTKYGAPIGFDWA